jgi:hypothetical protein
MRSENSPSAPATSYDDIPDALPTDDLAEEDLGSFDDDVDIALAPRKGKGKARVRVESDVDAEDGDEEGYVEALPVAKLPASYRLRHAVEPSFSIAPSSSPKRVGTPPRTVRGLRGAHGPFSPVKVRSSLGKSFPPATPSDEEGDVKPPAYKPTRVASDESPRPGSQSLPDPISWPCADAIAVPETAPNGTPEKAMQNDG